MLQKKILYKLLVSNTFNYLRLVGIIILTMDLIACNNMQLQYTKEVKPYNASIKNFSIVIKDFLMKEMEKEAAFYNCKGGMYKGIVNNDKDIQTLFYHLFDSTQIDFASAAFAHNNKSRRWFSSKEKYCNHYEELETQVDTFYSFFNKKYNLYLTLNSRNYKRIEFQDMKGFDKGESFIFIIYFREPDRKIHNPWLKKK